MNQSALNAFMARKIQIDAALEKLMAASENHFDVMPEDVNWGDASDLGRIAELLDEAAKIASGS